MKKRLLLIAVLCICTFIGQSQERHIQPPRPKVGVVLGGGGAKGASHIGVLKYLEEM
jgi:NTE family protein